MPLLTALAPYADMPNIYQITYWPTSNTGAYLPTGNTCTKRISKYTAHKKR